MVESGDSGRASEESPYDELLDVADRHARAWVSSIRERRIPPSLGTDEIKDRLGHDLPETGVAPTGVLDLLAEASEPGLMAMGSPRFFGWVIGGAQPVALAADWLVSTWDQNTPLRTVTPGVVAAEEGSPGTVTGRPL